MPWYGSHSFLNEYIRKNNCKRIMEIGVLNGDNARKMVEVAIQTFPPDEVGRRRQGASLNFSKVIP
jgi:hypothetical protein